MKRIILISILTITLFSCSKKADLISETNNTDTSFISKEKAIKFVTPEAGFHLYFLINNCKSANLELNTNDGKGWKPQIAAIGLLNDRYCFLYYFRYRFNVVRNNGSNWISSERICQF